MIADSCTRCRRSRATEHGSEERQTHPQTQTSAFRVPPAVQLCSFTPQASTRTKDFPSFIGNISL